MRSYLSRLGTTSGISGRILAFSLLLAATASAAVTIAPTSAALTPTAGSGSFALTVTPSAAWTAVSSASWLTVSPSSGSASATITYTFTANAGTRARTAAVVVGNRAFNVIQLGTAGAYTPWSASAASLTTIGGTSPTGFSGDTGQATAAKFARFTGVAVDRNSNVFLADRGNGRIRRIDASTGIVTTIAGTGSIAASGDTGPATAAAIGGIESLVTDLQGNLFFGDVFSGRVRKIDAATGIITTVIGNGTRTVSGDNGPAASATVGYPAGVAVDPDGNLYFSEYDANTIRRVDRQTGIVTRIAGTGNAGFSGDTGLATSAQFSSPAAITVDASGNLFVFDSANRRLRRVTPAGIVTTVAGNGSTANGVDGPALTSPLGSIVTMAADAEGNIVYGDVAGVVRKLDLTFSSIATVPNTLLTQANVALDAFGSIYIAETDTGLVRFLDRTTPVTSLSPTSVNVGAGAGSGSATLTISGAGTPWFAASSASWLTPTASGNGSGTLSYSYTANTGAARSATITVNGRTLTVNQASNVVLLTLSGLSATYTGSPQGVSVATQPTGISYGVTYNGSTTVPTNAGTYNVVATVTDPAYTGQTTGTLTIAKAAASLSLGPLTFTYDGTPKSVVVFGTPVGLSLGLTYDGSTTAPVNAGSYAVAAVSIDPNYSGSVSGTMVIQKAVPSITLSGLVQTFDGTPKPVTVTTTPSAGMTVTVTYNGSATVPSAAGSYAVSVTASGANYSGTTSGTLLITNGTLPQGSVSPVRTTATPASGSGSFTVTVSGAWSATSNADWFTISPANGSGNATITYNYTANTSTRARVAVVSVAGVSFSLLQVGTSGNYSAWGNGSFGYIWTIAGNGFSTPVTSNVPATQTAFSSPQGIAVDPAGNIFVTTYQNLVRKIDPITGNAVTIAGTGTFGSTGDGGPATSARLASPGAIAVDAAGNVFIAETGSYRIRRIDGATGIITAYAGSAIAVRGNTGDGGLATAASTGAVGGLALDAVGNLLIADSDYSVIRRINAATGIITTIAGTGSPGYNGDGGLATAAQLNQPWGIAVDAANNVFIAENYGNRVRKITASTGRISTVAGNGSASYYYSGTHTGAATSVAVTPNRVAVDPSGNIFVTDYNANIVRRVDTAGQISIQAGTPSYGYSSSGDGGPATSALFYGTSGLAVDQWGNLIVADSSSRVRFVDQSSAVISLSSASATAAQSAGSASVSLTTTPTGAYWAAASSSSWLTVSTPPGTGSGSLSYAFTANTGYSPRIGAIQVGGQTLTVTQAGLSSSLSPASATLSNTSGTGSFALTVSSSAAAWTAVSSASWLTVTGSGTGTSQVSYSWTANNSGTARTAQIIIADRIFSVLQPGGGSFNPWGPTAFASIRTLAGNGSNGGTPVDQVAAISTQLVNAQGFAVDSAGNLLIADGSRIRKVTAGTGIITSIAGGGSSFTEGAPATSVLVNPTSVAVDRSGNIIFSDTAGRIRRISAADSTVTTLAGTSGGSTQDGVPALTAQVSPASVRLDAVGNIYFVNTDTHSVRRIDAVSGIITTVAGTGTYGFSGDGGPATAARLYEPRGIALDSAGNIFIADRGNHRVRRVDALTGVITTIAGTGVGNFSGDGGPATAAALYYPSGVALDAAGAIYISDFYNHRVRRIAAGTITTLAGAGNYGFSGDGGPAVAARLYNPADLALDPAGNFYFLDSGNYRVRMVDQITPQVGLSLTSAVAPLTAGSASVAIVPAALNGQWYAVSSVSWITLGVSSGTGSATLTYQFTANNLLTPRTGTITVNGKALTITQAGATLTFGSASTTLGPGASSGSVAVTLSASVAWTAVSSASWLTLSSASGTGSGTLTFSATANTSSRARMAAAVAGGQVFAVVQLGTGGAAVPWSSASFYNQIRSIAGGGSSFVEGTPATSVTLSTGRAVADLNGNLYLIDNARIRRIDSATGLISNYAFNANIAYSSNSPIGDGGQATSASSGYYGLAGIAVDQAGNVYIADSFLGRIRRIDASTKVITTVAGIGQGSTSDGVIATQAYLSPGNLAVDYAGNIFFTEGNRIRRVDGASGLLSTVAGDGNSGFAGDGGPAVAARLSGNLGAIAVDSRGNLFISDNSNGRVRRIDGLSGVITTVAGGAAVNPSNVEGVSATSVVLNLASLALDGNGTLYIGESYVLRAVDLAAGTITTVSSASGSYYYNEFSGDLGPVTDAGVSPAMLTTDPAGNLYISQSGRIRFVDRFSAQVTFTPRSASVSRASGSGTAAIVVTPSSAPWIAASNASWLTPASQSGTGSGTISYSYSANTGVSPRGAVISVGGRAFSVSQPGATVAFSPSSVTIPAAAGSGSTALTVAAGVSWTAASSASWLRVTPASGSGDSALSYAWDGNTGTAARVARIQVGSAVFNVFQLGVSGSYTAWASSGYGRIKTIAGTGSYSYSGQDGVQATSTGVNGFSVSIDANGNPVITDGNNYRIRRVDASTGIISSLAGTGSSYGAFSEDVPATSVSLATVSDAITDSAGNLYIAGDNRVRIVDAATGLIRTFGGTGAAASATTGSSFAGLPATQVAFAGPRSLAFDSAGNLLVADVNTNNGAAWVRRIDITTGVMTFVAGTGTLGYSGDGGLATAAQVAPYAIATDSVGNIFLAEFSTGSHRVRRIDAATGIITTIAGAGPSGFTGDGGPATAARLSSPNGVAVDRSGNVFISDSGNARIRRVDAATSVISTVAGSTSNSCCSFSGEGLPATSATLYGLNRIALDRQGNLYIADYYGVRFVDYSSPENPRADLSLTKTHTGNFTQGQTGATYTITVTNLGNAATSGAATVTDTLPTGLTATALSGAGWTCTVSTASCTRSDSLAAGSAWPSITLTVDVASDARSPILNRVAVSGGGDTNTANNSASDSALIISGQTISFSAIGSQSLGGAPFELFALASSGLRVTFASTTTAVCSVSGSLVTLLTAGTCSITANQPGNTLFLAAPTVTRSFTVAAAPACSYALTPSSASSPLNGGSGSFRVLTGPACSWTASSAATWLSLTGTTSGTGPATVTYSVAANSTNSSRNGTVDVNGQTFTLTQFATTCSFSLSTSALQMPAAGGSATLNLTSSESTCPFTSSSTNATSLSIAPSSGSGPAQVTLTVAANPGATARTMTATIGGQNVQISQPGKDCTVGLSASSAAFAASGGPGSVDVTTQSGCTYGTVNAPSWISITSGATGSGPGGTVFFTVDSNSTTRLRSGTLNIGGQLFRIDQQGSGCELSLDTSALGSPFASAGGTGSIAVSASTDTCTWSANSSASWLTVTPTSGAGAASVSLSAAANTGSARSAIVNIGGHMVSVSQAGLVCDYSLRAYSATAPSAGGSGSVGVISAPACTWTSVANATWLTIGSSANTGTGDVQFTAAANTTATARTGTLTVAGSTFAVTQPGVTCAFSLSLASATAPAAGVTGSTFSVTSAASSCTATAVSFSNWLTVSTSSGGTTRTVTYSAAANPGSSPRTGIIKVANQTFTVLQTGGTCTFTLAAPGAVFGQAGGTGSIIATATGTGCSAVAGPSGFVTLGTVSGPVSGVYTLPYTVPAFASSSNAVRSVRITFGGKTYYVKQTSW